MSETCTQSTIRANHKSEDNSHPCILKMVLFVQQYNYKLSLSHFLDRDVKVKKIIIRIQALVFNAFSGESKLKTQ